MLLAARTLSGAALWVTIIAAHLVLLLGPPLISQDVFGYLDFARLGALHGLDPYTHVAAQAPTDPVYLFVGWPFQNSPYGPLFTLASYAIAPLGLAGGLWALEGARGRHQPRRDRAGERAAAVEDRSENPSAAVPVTPGRGSRVLRLFPGGSRRASPPRSWA